MPCPIGRHEDLTLGFVTLKNEEGCVYGKRCRTNYSLWGILQTTLPCNAYLHNSMSPPQRRIEDRIRELCAKAVASSDADLEPALQELSQLVRRTIEHMRESAKRLLVEGTPLSERRRRVTDNEV